MEFPQGLSRSVLVHTTAGRGPSVQLASHKQTVTARLRYGSRPKADSRPLMLASSEATPSTDSV